MLTHLHIEVIEILCQTQVKNLLPINTADIADT